MEQQFSNRNVSTLLICMNVVFHLPSLKDAYRNFIYDDPDESQFNDSIRDSTRFLKSRGFEISDKTLKFVLSTSHSIYQVFIADSQHQYDYRKVDLLSKTIFLLTNEAPGNVDDELLGDLKMLAEYEGATSLF